jgi:hypothetical protein
VPFKFNDIMMDVEGMAAASTHPGDWRYKGFDYVRQFASKLRGLQGWGLRVRGVRGWGLQGRSHQMCCVLLPCSLRRSNQPAAFRCAGNNTGGAVNSSSGQAWTSMLPDTLAAKKKSQQKLQQSAVPLQLCTLGFRSHVACACAMWLLVPPQTGRVLFALGQHRLLFFVMHTC